MAIGMWTVHVSRRRIARLMKTGAVVAAVSLYAYVLATRPLLPHIAPSVRPSAIPSLSSPARVFLSPEPSLEGSPSREPGALWLGRRDGDSSTGAVPVFGGRGLAGGDGMLDACGAPALARPARAAPTGVPGYGVVSEEHLPWHADPPRRLTELRQAAGTPSFVTGFRLTLVNPLWDEVHNVALAARHVAGRVVRPGETVSTVRMIGPITRERGYRDGPGYAGGRIVPTVGGGACKIGTSLYNAAVHAGLTVVERHPHSMVVPYVPPGRDAAIATGYKDVRFRNDYGTPVLLWAGMRDDTLFVAVYGAHEPPRIQWHHEELGREPAATVRRPNPGLPPGREEVTIPGQDGVTVRTWITRTDPDGTVRTIDMGTDAYRPLPQVVEYGP